jgi:hypothetical protein
MILDNRQAPFNVGLAVVLSSGASLTYSVEHTFDDVFSPSFNPATAKWFSHAVLASKTESLDGNYAYPVMAVRLNVTSYTGGSATMTVIQSGGGI